MVGGEGVEWRMVKMVSGGWQMVVDGRLAVGGELWVGGIHFRNSPSVMSLYARESMVREGSDFSRTTTCDHEVRPHEFNTSILSC